MNLIKESKEVVFGFVRSGLEVLPLLLIAGSVLALFVWASRYAPRLAGPLTRRVTHDVSLRRLAETAVRVLCIATGVVIASTIIFPGLGVGDLVSVLGLTSVAVGFAFKDIFQNFLAGIIILAQRPFHIGDQIKCKDIDGTVEDINIRSTQVRTFDGQRVVVPNADLYTNAVTVKTALDARRSIFTTGIGYGEDIEHAREVMHEALNRCERIKQEPAPAVFVLSHSASSIDFEILFWTEPTQADLRLARDEVATRIKRALDDANIEIPFPQRVVEIANPEVFQASRGAQHRSA